jgi:cytochrome c oxidase subunit 2
MNPQDYTLQLWPGAASAMAHQVDWLIIAFTIVTLFLVVPIFVCFTYWAWKYRRGRNVDRSYRESRNVKIELSWMLIPFAITLVFFVWAARLYDIEQHPPPNAMVVQAIGRQWMWKFQHPGGQWEINDLHVPENTPVLIDMISQDVVHDLYVPALRIQMDTIPGRRTQLWFTADRTGRFLLECAEFCGTDHSEMAGSLFVMTPSAYAAWLARAGAEPSMAAAGKRLFASYGCSGCHAANSTVRAPSLIGLYGHPVPVRGGGVLVADTAYIRDEILEPGKRRVAGYKQVMPSYAGKMPEPDLLRIIAYVQSLGQSGGGS